ncbi:MAG: hypothetical protein LBJ80_01155 [Rickettsiales bacterium]|jgi:hypothetical protein|nr:hypothetical protein [Rickettsiales bacterium]MDR1261017.1 hypothetical protein [Rickettsiales bacterium]
MYNLTDKQQKLYNKLKEAIEKKEQDKVASLLREAEGNLLAILTHANITYSEGNEKHILTPFGCAINQNNKKIIDDILGAIKDKNEILKDVLNASNITVELYNGKHTFTPLGFAIYTFNRQKSIEAILGAIEDKGVLKDVLTTSNITVELYNGKHTFTPLGFAIYYKELENIGAILGAIEDKEEVLKDVLTTPNITVEPTNGEKLTFTPFEYAICFRKLESIKATLGAANDKGILKGVFTIIKEDERNGIKSILEEAKNETEDHTEKAKIDGWLETLNQVENGVHRNVEEKERPLSESATQPSENTAKTEQVTNKPIIVGSVCGAIAALAVIGGCFAVGIQLPILTIAGIAVAAALAVGLIAGGITYAVSKPNSKVEETYTEKTDKREDLFPAL